MRSKSYKRQSRATKKKKKNDESDIRKSHQVSDIHAGHGSSQFMSLEEGEKYNKLYRYD